MAAPALIRALGPDDAEAFAALRGRALRDAPLAFLSSPEDDLAASGETVRAQLRQGPEAAVFGAFAPALVGCVGLHRDRHRKAAHKAHVWGTSIRRTDAAGIAAALVAALLAHARSLPGVEWVHLGVSDAAPAARRLYERAGFRTWGSEADALRHHGESTVEHRMALRLS
ncbi:MAG: GNAT family N-acetyltransferase [Candidatus Binatia bacterium]